jgi:hypothetical protein
MSADDLTARIQAATSNHERARILLAEASARVPAGERLTSSQRRSAWRQLAENPRAALLDPERDEIRRNGRPDPLRNPITGRLEYQELSHEPVARRDGGDQVINRDRRQHAALDPNRHLPRDERNYTPEQIDRIREAFWNREGYRDYIPESSSTSSTTAHVAGSVVPESVSRGGLRGASRVLAPIGIALDTYALVDAYNADGGEFGENFRSTAGGVVGGWGGAAAGAAAGAAIGSVIPGVGTVVGGVVGGVIGGFGGSLGGEFLGGLF